MVQILRAHGDPIKLSVPDNHYNFWPRNLRAFKAWWSRVVAYFRSLG